MNDELVIPYFGRDLDRDSCELLFGSLWKPKERALERELFRTKWFDVRHLHPVQATYLMGHLFTQETRSIIRKHIDDTPARVMPDGTVRDWEPLKSGDILEPPDGSPKRVSFWQRKINSLIRCRMYADSLGIPYTFFVKTGLDRLYFGRMYILDRKKLPEPGILNGKEMRDYILLKWGEELDVRIQYSDHPRYNIAAGYQCDDACDHEKWIIDQIKRKSDPKPAIRTFVGKRLISIDACKQAFLSASG
jgi:hypothetical protein